MLFPHEVTAITQFPIVTELDREIPENLLNDLIKIFPSYQRIAKTHQTFHMELGEGELRPSSNETTETPIYMFMDKRKVWKLSLSSSDVQLSTLAYSTQGEFLDNLNNTMGALERICSPKYYDRTLLHVRYIIPKDEQDGWKKNVKQELLGMLGGEIGEEVKSYNSEATLQLEGNASWVAVIRYGVVTVNNRPDLNFMVEAKYVFDNVADPNERETTIRKLFSYAENLKKEFFVDGGQP